MPTLRLVTYWRTCIPRFYLQENKTTKLTHGFGIYDLMNEHCVKIDITYIFLIHNNKSVWCVYTYFSQSYFNWKYLFERILLLSVPNFIYFSSSFILLFFICLMFKEVLIINRALHTWVYTYVYASQYTFLHCVLMLLILWNSSMEKSAIKRVLLAI